MPELMRFYRDWEKLWQHRNSYPINGTDEEKKRSPLATSLRDKELSLIKVENRDITQNSNFADIQQRARDFYHVEHGEAHYVVFTMGGEFFACIESEKKDYNDPKHKMIDTRNNIVEVSDMVYDGDRDSFSF